MAMSLVLTFPEPNVGRANSFPFSRMVGALICSRRNWVARICLFTATRSPATFSPAAFLPENVKTGIVSSLFYAVRIRSSVRSKLMFPAGHRFCRSGPGPAVQTGAAVDHFLKFIGVARPRQRHLQGDLLLEIQSRQGLI